MVGAAGMVHLSGTMHSCNASGKKTFAGSFTCTNQMIAYKMLVYMHLYYVVFLFVAFMMLGALYAVVSR